MDWKWNIHWNRRWQLDYKHSHCLLFLFNRKPNIKKYEAYPKRLIETLIILQLSIFHSESTKVLFLGDGSVNEVKFWGDLAPI